MREHSKNYHADRAGSNPRDHAAKAEEYNSTESENSEEGEEIGSASSPVQHTRHGELRSVKSNPVTRISASSGNRSSNTPLVPLRPRASNTKGKSMYLFQPIISTVIDYF